MMKKKTFVIASVLCLLLIGSLYQTFALISNVEKKDNDVYSINIDDTLNVSVPSKSSKIIYFKIKNLNHGNVKYGVGYSSSNIKVKVFEDSKDPVSGDVGEGESKFIRLKLINDSTSNDTVTLSAVLGYENGGNLIPSSGVNLVSEKILNVNLLSSHESSVSESSMFFDTSLARNKIESITTVNDNIVPVSALGSYDLSSSGDGSIKLWYFDSDSNGLYEVYIGCESGTIYLPYESSLMFAHLTNVTSVDLTHVDSTKVYSLASMFYNCGKMVTVNLSSFVTSSLGIMANMFNGCSSLVSVDLSNFKTSNVINFSNLFNNCSSLVSVDLSGFDTSNVTNMSSMFNGCSSLKSLNLSQFNTSKVTDMSDMFSTCYNMESLDLSSFDTSNVTSMSGMFFQCKKLTTLDLSSFNTAKVTNMNKMFMQCFALTTIYVSDTWSTSNVTTANLLFQDDTVLKGAVSYNASNVTISMANYSTGYLTYKANS